MKPVWVSGLGAVSPAGWGVEPLLEAVQNGKPLATGEVEGPRTFRARLVPRPTTRPAILSHPRLRRSSPISQYAAAAAQQAVQNLPCLIEEIGILFSTMCGSVRYTRRFYAETLDDPSTASPILFPETVFNAPASHVAAALQAPVPAYSLVGDSSVFLQALATGANWVASGFVKAALVIAAEESDWSVLEGWRLFSRKTVTAEGAAAICLTSAPVNENPISLEQVYDPFPFEAWGSPQTATAELARQMPPPIEGEYLVDSRSGIPHPDAIENALWPSWPGPRTSPRAILGEAMTAATGWQCIIAASLLAQSPPRGTTFARVVSVGCNHQSMGARLARSI